MGWGSVARLALESSRAGSTPVHSNPPGRPGDISAPAWYRSGDSKANLIPDPGRSLKAGAFHFTRARSRGIAERRSLFLSLGKRREQARHFGPVDGISFRR